MSGESPVSIVPSVLPADFSRLGEEVADLDSAGVDRIQWDVMDGRFVPNLTFGPDVIAACRKYTQVPFEAHLMVVEPDLMLKNYVDAGCEIVIVHEEACTHLHRTLASIRDMGAKAGVAGFRATAALAPSSATWTRVRWRWRVDSAWMMSSPQPAST